MKKPLTLVVGFLVVLGVSSCTKEYYDVVPNKTFIYTIKPNDWKWDEGVSHQIYHDIDLPELTDYYITQGNVSVAMSDNGEVSYDILPSTFGGTAFSVRYTAGFVTIYAEDPIADPEYEVPIPTATMTVKITLSDAEYIP
ncbi:hypothetical protein [Parapedobacter indicus]|uniref:Uncharacterized protein n=1 Tax=Parapedobacter indicus TaxID=1477437 RepID=A0A1I3CGN7_9SPHI|nr:hypothetical protein [Parapedobacter indicus]PPL04231.1 hypothetical protein CLV26_10132 [Parapedobacter indicus]SFH73379.1 hypothetical protein SAMN05444682_10119 [Parapedobacter indicus]